MRKLSPAIIATAVAMAFASTAATAQRIGVATATGTNGSTVTSSTTSAGTSGTTAAGTTGASTTRSNLGLERRADVQTAPAGSAPVSNGPAFDNSEDRRQPTDSTTTTTTTTSASGFATQTNDVTANNGNAAPIGSALGTSAGQTSAGTAGAQSAGAGVTGITNPNLGLSGTTVASAQGTIVNANGSTVNGLNGGTLTGNVIVPGAAGFAGTGFTGGMGDASGVNVNGERVGSGGADFRVANNVVVAPTPTPIFNQAAARGAARDAARRARGDEPRIIGLAPRTDRDLTHQMPDDPIIRY